MFDILGEQMKQEKSGNMHIIRLHLDAYSEKRITQNTSIKVRITTLLETIEKEPTLHNNITNLLYTRSDSTLPGTCPDPE